MTTRHGPSGNDLIVAASQRKLLYEAILDHISGIGDLPMVLEAGDPARAERLTREFRDDLTVLIEDLGFEGGTGGPVRVRSEPELVRRVLRRLLQESERAELAEARERAVVDAEAAHHASLRETCMLLLEELD